MTNEQYMIESARTTSDITEPRKRASGANLLTVRLLLAGIEANQLDAMKKVIFYGKDPATLHIPVLKDASAFLVENPTIAEHYKQQMFAGEDINIFHAVLGIFTESYEILQTIPMNLVSSSSNNFDKVNLIEELGDLFWYMALMCRALGVTFSDVQERNIAKLRARYPVKFTDELAVNRNLELEREILEGKRSEEKQVENKQASASGTYQEIFDIDVCFNCEHIAYHHYKDGHSLDVCNVEGCDCKEFVLPLE